MQTNDNGSWKNYGGLSRNEQPPHLPLFNSLSLSWAPPVGLKCSRMHPEHARRFLVLSFSCGEKNSPTIKNIIKFYKTQIFVLSTKNFPFSKIQNFEKFLGFSKIQNLFWNFRRPQKFFIVKF